MPGHRRTWSPNNKLAWYKTDDVYRTSDIPRSRYTVSNVGTSTLGSIVMFMCSDIIIQCSSFIVHHYCMRFNGVRCTINDEYCTLASRQHHTLVLCIVHVIFEVDLSISPSPHFPLPSTFHDFVVTCHCAWLHIVFGHCTSQYDDQDAMANRETQFWKLQKNLVIISLILAFYARLSK